MTPLLALTPGMGVGPEVIAAALRHLGLDRVGGAARVVLIGRGDRLESTGLDLERVEAADRPARRGVALVEPTGGSEPAEVEAIRLAAEACLAGRVRGMVTGPIHKAKLVAQGFSFSGHTDFLAHLCGENRAVMAFAGGSFCVALVTTHLPLRFVPARIRADEVEWVVRTAVGALRADLGMAAPRVAVCGLNPHAGEGGVLGTEDADEIEPACRRLVAEGLDLVGPVSAETAFLSARRGELDLVVAMYHDQGLVPLKVLDFGRSVNWTLGLPILRTSVDHGTADALVGTGRADPASAIAAIELALRIALRRAIPSIAPSGRRGVRR